MVDSKKRIKFSKWRPVGVCDTAAPGVMKAQMFTRKDYLIVTGSGVTRDNWKKKPEVRKIVYRYAKKLASMSSKTQGMKNPQASKIKLMGSIIRLEETPTLNMESETGKMQLFQVEFVDQAKVKKRTWLGGILILSLLLASLLLFLPGGKKENKQVESRNFRSSFQLSRTPFCEGNRNSADYSDQLDEVQWALQSAVDILKWEESLQGLPNCSVGSGAIGSKEKKLLRCYNVIQKNNALYALSQEVQNKTNRCVRQLCKQRAYLNSGACQ